ncbi:hypothetical protein KW795_01830 [Candidatus Microgenomates bacterium]|nr:hypothetical protein [Candidatus Microgenomates bacterium]
MAKKKKNSSLILKLFIFFIILLGIVFAYLYKNRYLKCLLVSPSMCLSSRYFKSELGLYSFRYPKNYPLTHLTGEKLKKFYNGDFGILEWVNFSVEFYPNAGGDRLGDVIVQENKQYKSDIYENKYFANIKEYVEKELNTFDVPPVVEYTKIDGVDAVCSDLKSQPHSFSNPSYDCYVIYKGNFYTINFDYNSYYHKESIEYYKKAREIVLSTFQFE